MRQRCRHCRIVVTAWKSLTTPTRTSVRGNSFGVQATQRLQVTWRPVTRAVMGRRLGFEGSRSPFRRQKHWNTIILSQLQEDKPAIAQHKIALAAPKNIATGLLLAIFGAIGFSGKAIIVKLAYRYEGVDPVTLIMLRMLFALPVFLLMAWWASRGKPALSRKDWFAVLYLGFTGYYLSSFLDFIGLLYITASLERLILYLNPTIILLIGLLLYKRKV